MTYNIHHAEGRDGKVDLDRIADVIRAAHADVICLQEVDRDLPRTQHLDFPKLLAEKLGITVVFEPNYHFEGGDYGNATLTNLPIVSHENLKLPGPPDAEPRGCLRTTVRAGELTVDVLNAHLGLDEKQREEQTSAILKAVRDVPTILASDMNETAAGPGVGAILARLRDAAEGNAAEKGNTIPARNPERRIDFIFVSKDIAVSSCDVLSTPVTATASDHLPCIADVNVRAPRDKDAEKGVYNNDDKRVTEAISEGK
jgi:endonuclease/exonuclease/phosphatase family metal-dependent hydrolase